jgi:hypothetical protein
MVIAPRTTRSMCPWKSERERGISNLIGISSHATPPVTLSCSPRLVPAFRTQAEAG